METRAHSPANLQKQACLKNPGPLSSSHAPHAKTSSLVLQIQIECPYKMRPNTTFGFVFFSPLLPFTSHGNLMFGWSSTPEKKNQGEERSWSECRSCVYTIVLNESAVRPAD